MKEKQGRSRTGLRSTTQRGVRKAKKDPATSSRQHHTSVAQNVVGASPKTAASRTKQLLQALLPGLKDDKAADANRSTSFLSLPAELIHEISGSLPLESAICLTLTCKALLGILGTSSWFDASVKKRWYRSEVTGLEHRPLFLHLLASDAADLDFCERCNTLHPPLKPPRAHRPTKLTKYCFGPDALIDYMPHDSLKGYSLVFPHVQQALQASDPPMPSDGLGPSLDQLGGNFTIQCADVAYTLQSSARRIQGNLIIKHEHSLQTLISKRVLRATDVLSLPLRLCPHQTTSTQHPPHSRHTGSSLPNGPVLTHAIVAAFPAALRTGAPRSSAFRRPTPLERDQMAAADAGDDVLWRCRSCPTKFQIHHGSDNEGGELVITAWHCFGHDMYSAQKYWRMFVRREGEMLGKTKRNSEFYRLSKSVPDFSFE